ncbi:MAG: YidC/Oxa1 family membrane protein insertase [Porticoccaceae bacterium]|jgi:YidC/Oxa1 family membrane protein insertase|tara:strand:+ start:8646 stop:10313 length:1668 start_codon:yes stop_codon:yes gene_type:complete
MDWLKATLLGGMAIVAWLLVIQWTQFQEGREPEVVQQSSYAMPAGDSLIPEVQFQGDNEVPELTTKLAPSAFVLPQEYNLVRVESDVLEVIIDTLGGDIIEVNLLKHLTKMADDGGKPFQLLNRTANNVYIAQSGLVGPNGTDTRAGRPQFSTSSNAYDFNDGSELLNVDLSFYQEGVRLVKRFTFSRTGYDIAVEYQINNGTSLDWNATFYGQIKRDSHAPPVSSAGVRPYLGAALREEEKNFAKHDFSDMEEKKVEGSIVGGWVAMVQHYFISAWIPPAGDQNQYSLRKLPSKDVYLMGFTGQPLTVLAGESGSYVAQFYVGPKDQTKLAELAEYLDLTVDYGFLWMLAKPIFFVMKWIHDVIGNWGWSIILLTLAIKILLYPLSATSLKSMAKMRNLQPEMARLKELYGDDRQKMSQELMGLYKKEKVNPAGGCFPMLLQMPVFLSLYWVLLESVEIRHAPWIFWIQDLSAKDPYFILPLVMGASMLLMQKMQPMPTDPMQAKVMQIMPIAFTFFFMVFPAGLVLYWTVNNLLSMAQQWYVNRQLLSSGKGK